MSSQTLEEIRNNLTNYKGDLEKIESDLNRLSHIARDLINALLADEDERRKLIAYAVANLARFAMMVPDFNAEIDVRAGGYDIITVKLLDKSVEIHEGSVYRALAVLMSSKIDMVIALINKVREEINRAIDTLNHDVHVEEI